ncbi:hypothetical protein AMTRI_Chr01g130930 [Amborella trichopoda]
MDAKARNAVLRAKLKEAAQKREKPLDDPLVRYNDLDQPVCKICNVAVKSESLWLAHKTSRKHLEVKLQVSLSQYFGIANVAAESVKQDSGIARKTAKLEDVGSLPVAPLKNENIPVSSHLSGQTNSYDMAKEGFHFHTTENIEERVRVPSSELATARNLDKMETKQVKGALPEGFFDNKDADLRARGIEPFDAAEQREEMESLEQKVLNERVEMLKKKQLELKAAKFANSRKRPAYMGAETSEESSSDDDENEENFAVDWRAKHL